MCTIMAFIGVRGRRLDGGQRQLAPHWRILPDRCCGLSVARTPNNLDLFITGNDRRVYTSWWYAGAWSGVSDNWRSIGGIFLVGERPASVARRSNQLDLFITGNDGRVYTEWWNQG